ncbi:tumor necrosis factor receptor superfamily member 6 [Carettochelys insculpta]|uniref:tumor necrosis factor receptor superfamily member 6 n=1 Tax=Carettochelys insculpta TaxID=44489 RepID=UPI003EC08211
MSAALLFLRLLLVVGCTTASHHVSDVPGAHMIYDKLSIKRNISKRELQCGDREYATEGICCETCKPGFYKAADCTKDNKTTDCKPCNNGSFMDHFNSLPNCLRCQICDTKFGLETAEPCQVTQNVKCRCAQHYFCNSSGRCEHCDPCSKCENGAVEKECTPTTDTVCKSKGNVHWIYIVVGIVIICLAAIAVYCCKKKQQNYFDVSKKQLDQDVHKKSISVEMEPLTYSDVDLSTQIPAIVEEMTLSQVKSFVRKNKIPETDIEQTIHDNLNDSAEQKIKLFHLWYQSHGMKGAYGNLMRSLQELKLRTVADKIEKKLNVVTFSTQEKAISNVDADE